MALDFAARLARLELSKRAFARLVADLSGSGKPKYRTVEDWGNCTAVPDTALALLTLLEQARKPTPRMLDAGVYAMERVVPLDRAFPVGGEDQAVEAVLAAAFEGVLEDAR